MNDKQSLSSNKVKQQTLRRLSIVEGHLRKVKQMVEEGEYCPNVIHQSQAVQAALKKVDEIILHGHLHSCVLGDVHGSAKERLTEEIVGLFTKRR